MFPFPPRLANSFLTLIDSNLEMCLHYCYSRSYDFLWFSICIKLYLIVRRILHLAGLLPGWRLSNWISCQCWLSNHRFYRHSNRLCHDMQYRQCWGSLPLCQHRSWILLLWHGRVFFAVCECLIVQHILQRQQPLRRFRWHICIQ